MNTVRQSSESADPLPPVLYKYLPPERIDILENMELHFSRPTDFNDNFDTHYNVPKSQGARAKVERVKLKNRLGILCLTQRPDNHMMWVHYARNHTGFVLGFDSSAAFFRENRTLRRVIYRSRPKVLLEPGVDACFYKSEVWKDEEEWRCVQLFEPTISRTIGIEPRLITEVILGSQMEGWQIARIMLYAKAYEMTQARFFLSSLNRSSWTIENLQKNITLCKNCIGSGYLMED
jgi:hypothetical protein